MEDEIKKIIDHITASEIDARHLGLDLILAAPWYKEYRMRYSKVDIDGPYKTYGDLCDFWERIKANNYSLPFMSNVELWTNIKKSVDLLHDFVASNKKIR